MVQIHSQVEQDIGTIEATEHQRLISKNKKGRKGCWKVRHTLVLLGFFGFANVYAMRVNLSVAIVAMVNHTAIPHVNQTSVDICPDLRNETSITETGGEFAWDEYKQGIILGSFFWGYIVTQYPGGRLAELFGAHKLLGYGILWASFFTLLTPTAARIGDVALIFCRIFTGLGEGVTFPSMYVMLSHWAPPFERSKMATFIFTGAQFGTVVTLPLTGLLCEYGFDGGWPTAFYVFGGLGLVWFTFWMSMITDTPLNHRTISPEEREYICSSLKHSPKKKLVPVPYRQMLTSPPVWAVGIANIGHAWGFYTLLTELPTYMDNILHFGMKKNSFVSALPYLMMWLLSISFSTVADHLVAKQILPVSTTRKLFNSIGQYGPALALIGASFTGCSTVGAVSLLTLAVGLSGATYSGFQVNYVEIAPQFSGTLFGITNSLGNICGFAAPYVVGSLVRGNQTLGQWRLVFFIAAGVYVFAGTIFMMFASGQVQRWTVHDRDENESINTSKSDND